MLELEGQIDSNHKIKPQLEGNAERGSEHLHEDKSSTSFENALAPVRLFCKNIVSKPAFGNFILGAIIIIAISPHRLTLMRYILHITVIIILNSALMAASDYKHVDSSGNLVQEGSPINTLQNKYDI